MRKRKKHLPLLIAITVGIVLVAGWLFNPVTWDDPLSKAMRQYGYSPIVPTPEYASLGDVFVTADLKEPEVLMRDLFSTEEIAEIMKKMGL